MFDEGGVDFGPVGFEGRHAVGGDANFALFGAGGGARGFFGGEEGWGGGGVGVEVEVHGFGVCCPVFCLLLLLGMA